MAPTDARGVSRFFVFFSAAINSVRFTAALLTHDALLFMQMKRKKHADHDAINRLAAAAERRNN